MDKRKVVLQIQEYLAQQLSEIPESEYEAQAEKIEGLRSLILMYRFLPTRDYTDEDVACPSALVELDLQGTRAHYYIAPQGGGLITTVEGRPVQVITPNSPLGEALLGKKAGESFEVDIRGARRTYKIIEVR